jgi:hypothetical protein
MTAIENVKLYRVCSRAKTLNGWKKVPCFWFVLEHPQELFGADGLLGVPYCDVIDGYNRDDQLAGAAELAAEELFTEAEAEQLVEWLRVRRKITARIEPAELPIDSSAFPLGFLGPGIIPHGLGGALHGFLMVYEDEDYDLPFKAATYYHAYECESIEGRRIRYPKFSGIPALYRIPGKT